MNEEIQKKLIEIQKETNQVYKLEQLKALRKKLMLYIAGKEITPKKKNDLDNLLKSICNN